ncbi:MAG: GLPGLI family protein [Bacteroidetes bacterium]|nr:GLPGLI family protein [Bacteroidota bacterium]
MEESPEHMVVIRIGDDDRGSVYKNLQQKQIIKQIEFFGRSFLIRETLKPITWKIGTEQKTIGTYKCIKATATIDTMNVASWFCPDLAINDGPDIFGDSRD